MALKNLFKLAPFAGRPWNLPHKFHLYLIWIIYYWLLRNSDSDSFPSGHWPTCSPRLAYGSRRRQPLRNRHESRQLERSQTVDRIEFNRGQFRRNASELARKPVLPHCHTSSVFFNEFVGRFVVSWPIRKFCSNFRRERKQCERNRWEPPSSFVQHCFGQCDSIFNRSWSQTSEG